MNNSWNDELISAYVDGELTAEEQAQVEQALASDARLRQMHDDLRALRHSLQAMPRVKLDAGFAARVLEAAQKAKAAQSPVVPAASVASPAAPLLNNVAASAVAEKHAEHHHLAVVPAHPTEPTSWHVMVWSLFGAAAALLLVLLWPGSMSQVAERPTKPGETQVAQIDAAKVATSAQPIEEKGEAAVPLAAPLNKDRANESERKELPQTGVEENKPEFDLRRKEAIGAERRGGVFSGDFSDGSDSKLMKKSIPFPGNVRSDPRGGGAPVRMSSPSGKGGNEQVEAASGTLMPNKDKADAVNRGQSLERLVVVRLSVPADVLKRRGIDGTLAKNGITIATAEVEAKLSANKRDLERTTEKEGVESAAAGNAPPDGAADAPQSAAVKGLAESDDRAVQAIEGLAIEGLGSDEFARVAGTADDVDVLYMEASQEQLDKTLQDLQAQPGVSIEFSDTSAEESKELGDSPARRSRLTNGAGGFGGGLGGGEGLGGGGLGAAGFGNAKSAKTPGVPEAALAPAAPPAPVVAGPASASPPKAEPGAASGRGFAPPGEGAAEKFEESNAADKPKPAGRGGANAPTPARGLAGDDQGEADRPAEKTLDLNAKAKSRARPGAAMDELQQNKDAQQESSGQGYARRVPVAVFRRQAEELLRSRGERTKQAANGTPPAPPAPAPALRGSPANDLGPRDAETRLQSEKPVEAGKKSADSANEVQAPRVRVLFVIEAQK